MITSYTNKQTPIPSNAISPRRHRSSSEIELNRLGTELDQAARRLARKGVLRQVHPADAGEVCQDSILIALGWKLRGDSSPVSESEPRLEGPWSPEKAIAGAMKITKLRYFSERSKRDERLAELKKGLGEYFATSFHHDYDLSPSNWPTETAREVVKAAVISAIQASRLNRSNGRIALFIYHELETVEQVAKRFGVTRGAIYQRLDRMRPVIRHFIDLTEMTPSASKLIHNSTQYNP